MGVGSAACWLTPSELNINQLTLDEIVREIKDLPRIPAVESITTALSQIDLNHTNSHSEMELALIRPEVRTLIHSLRASQLTTRVVFHPAQLFWVLSLLILYGDQTSDQQSLDKLQLFKLGSVCVQVSGLPEAQRTSENWTHNPIDSEYLELQKDLFLSMQSDVPHMSIVRASRILFSCLRQGELKLKVPEGTFSTCFENHFGVSFERAWAMLAFICQLRYPRDGSEPHVPFVEMRDIPAHFKWSPQEVAGFKSFAVKSLDDLALDLAKESIDDFGTILTVLMASPIIEIREHHWWSHGPFLANSLIRKMWNGIHKSLSTSDSEGMWGNVFGTAVEMYVNELICLVNEHRNNAINMRIAPKLSGWNAKKPEFEIVSGPVIQLLEVKSKYFKPDFRNHMRSPLAFLKSELFDSSKGMCQLANYAVGRYMGYGTPKATRIQSLLITLENWATWIPGAQQEARAAYKFWFLEVMKDGDNDKFSQKEAERLPQQTLILNMEEFEFYLGLIAEGDDPHIAYDRIYNRQGSNMLSASQSFWMLQQEAPSYIWLQPMVRDVFEIYCRNLWK